VRYQWIIKVDDTSHTVVLFESKHSGKRRVLIDGQ